MCDDGNIFNLCH